MGRETCRWAADRLPLLAGGELLGLERRRAERHVLDCPSCRERLGSLRVTIDTLRTVGLLDPFPPEAPSLSPDLTLQIQESRRNPVPGPARERLRRWVRRGLAAAVLLVASGAGLWALNQNYHVSVRLDVRPRDPKPAAVASQPRFASGEERPVPIRRSSHRRVFEDAPLIPAASDNHPRPRPTARSLADLPRSTGPSRPPAEPTH